MRVLCVYADPGVPLDGTKGASIHARQTLSCLLRRGAEVTVLAARRVASWELPCRLLQPDPGSRASLRGTGPGLERELDALAAARDLADLVPFGPGAVDVVYERYALWSLAGALLAERLAAPLVLEVNAPLPEEQARWRGLALHEVASGLERFLLRRADALLCVSSALVERAVEIRGRSDGVHLFPNAVDTGLFSPAQAPVEERESRDGPCVVFVGSLKPWHGLDVLLRAFALVLARVPEARLLLVGDGPERPRLEQLAETLEIVHRTTFIGALPHARVPALLRQADAAVAPYPPLDGFYFSPIKLAEYLAAGVPVVASDCGDHATWLEDGVSSLLVPPGDAGALAGALLRIMDDPALRRRLAEEGRRLAVERLSLEAASTRLERLLRGVAAPHAEVR